MSTDEVQKQGEVTIRAMQMTAWNGALPPPDMAKAYEEIEPGAFKRLLAEAEKEAEVRRSITIKDHEDYNRSVFKGLNYAFVLTMTAFVGAIVCALCGCEKAAIAFVGATVVNLASVFIGRKNAKQ